jgi:hypothetical protein
VTGPPARALFCDDAQQINEINGGCGIWSKADYGPLPAAAWWILLIKANLAQIIM